MKRHFVTVLLLVRRPAFLAGQLAAAALVLLGTAWLLWPWPDRQVPAASFWPTLTPTITRTRTPTATPTRTLPVPAYNRVAGVWLKYTPMTPGTCLVSISGDFAAFLPCPTPMPTATPASTPTQSPTRTPT